MNPDWFIIGVLVVLLIGQNIYWAKINQCLIDKLMSRNYYDYAIAEKTKNLKPQMHQPPQDDVIDPESDRQAQELNTLFNMA